MKLGKATIFVHSHQGNENPIEALKETLAGSDLCSAELFDVEVVEIGDWYDDIDLNTTGCTQEQYETYFTDKKQALIEVVNMAVSVMETSYITKMSVDQAIEMSIKQFLLGSTEKVVFDDNEISEIKERCIKVTED